MPVGYQNGFGVVTLRQVGFWAWLMRWFHRKPNVQVAGQDVKIIGQIGAFETLLDVTDLKCSPGDEVTFPMEPLHAKGLKVEYK